MWQSETEGIQHPGEWFGQEDAGWQVPLLLPVPRCQPGPLWRTYDMATPTSVLGSFSQKKSQIPATLIRTGFLLPKLLLGLSHLHTDQQ